MTPQMCMSEIDLSPELQTCRQTCLPDTSGMPDRFLQPSTSPPEFFTPRYPFTNISPLRVHLPTPQAKISAMAMAPHFLSNSQSKSVVVFGDLSSK